MKRFVSLLTLALVALLGLAASAAQADDPDLKIMQPRWSNIVPDSDPSLIDFPQEDIHILDTAEDGGGDFELLDECDEDLYSSCDRYDDKAPIISAAPMGTYPEGSFAMYTYEVPPSPKAAPYGVSVNAHAVSGESEETGGPVAFVAITDEESNTISFDSTDGSDDLSAGALAEDEPRYIWVGMYAQDPQTLTEKHWVGIDTITLAYEKTDPTGTISPPTGWIDETYPGIPIEAEDQGLGLVVTLMLGTKRNPSSIWDWYSVGDSYCDAATLLSGCPMSLPTGYRLDIRPSLMKEGYSSASMVVGNVFGEGLNSGSFPLKIDTQQPSVSLGGSFTTAPGMVLDGPLYELETDAADGNATVHNSGVKKIQVLVDNVEIDSDSQSCPGDDCGMELDTDIEPDNWSNGEHTLTVKVTDQVGHLKTQNVNFEVDR